MNRPQEEQRLYPTRPPSRRRRASRMRNILAIAQKELRSYFASPIAYITIGFFALLYGYFYIAILSYFVRQSMQMGQFGGGPQSLNINQVLIRQLFQNVTILILF